MATKSEPARMLVCLSRREWLLIVNGWETYLVVTPIEKQDNRWEKVIPKACRMIREMLRGPGDHPSVPGTVDGWALVSQWLACVSCCGSPLVWPGIGRSIAIQISEFEARTATRNRETATDGR